MAETFRVSFWVAKTGYENCTDIASAPVRYFFSVHAMWPMLKYRPPPFAPHLAMTVKKYLN